VGRWRGSWFCGIYLAPFPREGGTCEWAAGRFHGPGRFLVILSARPQVVQTCHAAAAAERNRLECRPVEETRVRYPVKPHELGEQEVVHCLTPMPMGSRLRPLADTPQTAGSRPPLCARNSCRTLCADHHPRSPDRRERRYRLARPRIFYLSGWKRQGITSGRQAVEQDDAELYGGRLSRPAAPGHPGCLRLMVSNS
jgi:hypothetical protein